MVSGGHIPSQWAHSINTIKHAQGFLKLGLETEIFTIEGILETIFKLKIKDIQRFYDISEDLRISYYKDNFFYYYKDIPFLTRFLKKIKLLLPILSSFNNPEKKISNYCLNHGFNLSYCRTYRTAYYNILKDLPTIIEMHSPYLNDPEMQKLLTLSRKKNFLGIVTISNILKEKIINKRVPDKKVLVLDGAVDLSRFELIKDSKYQIRKKLKLPSDKKIILYAGSLRKERGIDLIIKSSHELKNKEYYFIIIGGKKKQINYWTNFMKKKNIRSNFYFLGYKQNSLIPLYLKSADILLAPYSTNCLTVKWMSPIKIFEYMASGVPIIASDVKRMKEICSKDECIFFKADNHIDLTRKIEYLIQNENLQKSIVKNSLNEVKNHSYERRCKKILETFSPNLIY